MNTEGSALRPISSCSPIPRPDLSNCHRCGLRFPIDGSIDRFQILKSQWRIVLLCHACLDGIGSARVCSYCFLGFPELEKGLLDCIICSCRVHYACLPLHHRSLWSSPLDSGNFMCMDCNPFQRFRGSDFNKSGVSTSQSGSRDFFEEKPILRKKMTDGNTRKNTVKKLMVVRGSPAVTEKAEGAVQLGSTNINYTVSDEQLALRLHQSMNGSQRISRSLYPKGETHLTLLRKMPECNGCFSRIVDSNTFVHHSKVNVCPENKPLFVGRENSQFILTNNFFESDEDLSKKVTGPNTEGLASFPLKARDIYLNSPDFTSYESNIGSSLLPINSLKSQLNNNTAVEKCSVGEGSTELQQKTIDALGLDRYKKHYFRRRWSSRRFVGC